LSLSVRVSNAVVIHLSHLGLPVRGLQRSQQFYPAYFGFGPGTAREGDDGTVIIGSADGFDLAPHRAGQVGLSPGFPQVGVNSAGPADVRAPLDRMAADGVTPVKRTDEPACVAFKCRDRDGHRIEVYRESVRVR